MNDIGKQNNVQHCKTGFYVSSQRYLPVSRMWYEQRYPYLECGINSQS